MVQCEVVEINTSVNEIRYQFLIASANYLNIEVSDKKIKEIVKNHQ